MVRPTVEFASCVWDPHERVDNNIIEMVQPRGARFVKHRYHNRSSVTDLLEDLKWKSLETRRKESRLTMMYKIVNQQLAVDPDKHLMKPQKQSRSANNNSYVVTYASTTSRQQSFIPRTIRDWNQLPLSVKKASSVSAFKAQLATYLIKLGLHLTPTENNVPSKKMLSFSPSLSPLSPSFSFPFSLFLSLSLSLSRSKPPLGRIFKLLNVANKDRRRKQVEHNRRGFSHGVTRSRVCLVTPRIRHFWGQASADVCVVRALQCVVYRGPTSYLPACGVVCLTLSVHNLL